MILSLGKEALAQYVSRQLDQIFPDDVSTPDIGVHLNDVLDRVDYCFSAVSDKYFIKADQTYFNHLHSDQYAMFLYFLSNTLYQKGADRRICDKLFYLNKALHGIDVFYEVELPSIFLFSHCLGTVLGRASYSDYLRVQQNSTIGGARSAKPGENVTYPVLGKYLAVYAGASVLGNCTVGDNCKISANSLLLDQSLAPNTLYIGTRTSHILKDNEFHDNIWRSTDEDSVPLHY